MAQLSSLWTLNPANPSSSPGNTRFHNPQIPADHTDIGKIPEIMRTGLAGRNTAMEEKGLKLEEVVGGVGVGVDFIINNVDSFYY